MMYGEFFDLKEIDVAQSLLNDGLTRAGQLMAGQAPWTIQTGPVTRGDISKIDGSVQPYGLVIPESFTTGAMRWRLDVWFHGRGEQLSKVKFLNQRRQDKGQFTPPQTTSQGRLPSVPPVTTPFPCETISLSFKLCSLL